jgi:hypothetical protein
MVHVQAHPERLRNGFRPIHRKHREKLLYRQRMLAAHTLNRRDQQFCIRLHRETDKAGDRRRFLPNRHGLHEPGLGIDYRAGQQSRFFLIADMRAQLGKFSSKRGHKSHRRSPLFARRRKWFPLSKVFETMMSTTAVFKSADFSK